MLVRSVLVAGAILALLPGGASAGGASDPLHLPGPPAEAVTASAKPVPPPAPLTEAQKYCQNVAAAAADARFAWQTKRLTALEAEVKQKVGELQAKQAELQVVLDRYDDAMKRAKASLVDIYAHMRPETAATQLSILDDDVAAAVLAQLTAQKASAILNEIAPERAAKIVTTMTTLLASEKKS